MNEKSSILNLQLVAVDYNGAKFRFIAQRSTSQPDIEFFVKWDKWIEMSSPSSLLVTVENWSSK